jgi:SAM-dependent methyltransferase
MRLTPAAAQRYDAWYDSARGRWIAATECALLLRLLRPVPAATLLDAGSGSGRFSHCFAAAGLDVVSLDPDPAMLAVAQCRAPPLPAVRGNALALPFGDGSFDYAAAVTSLCFVEPPGRALAELWRVCRRGVVLGLLNRHSLLHHRKRGHGGYRGARWDSVEDVVRWSAGLLPQPVLSFGSAVFVPGGGRCARWIEARMPPAARWGGFLAVALHKP